MNEERATRYVCTRCGACCKWPGDVTVDEGEQQAIADHLGIPLERFRERYTRLNHRRSDRPDGACAFLAGDDTCLVYPARPRQCRSFPNGWNFPGFRESCPAVPIRFRMQRLRGRHAHAYAALQALPRGVAAD